MEVFYSGFNGFKQVPTSGDKDTLTCLTVLNKSSQQHNNSNNKGGAEVVDVAICWNYLVVGDTSGITKYGLVNNKPCLERLDNPPGSGGIVQTTATPRYILSVTEEGQCWTNEEGKGWRRVVVSSESEVTDVTEDKDAENEAKADTNSDTDVGEQRSDDEDDTDAAVADQAELATSDPGEEEEEEGDKVKFVTTACGDYHNLAIDASGAAYSLPNKLSLVTSPPGLGQPRVTQVVCGKEHCMLLTEHGQVYTWGGGSRGQLGHGTLASEERPRLVMALDGMKIIKIAAGGWHSAAISECQDLYMFGWNESGQLAQPTNLARPAECFSAVEKLLMACCTGGMAEGAALPRGDTEDTEVYRKRSESGDSGPEDRYRYCVPEPEKEALSCYTGASCDTNTDIVTVQPTPMLVTIGAKNEADNEVLDVSCGSRHTVCLSKSNVLWSFGWNKYGQLGTGDTKSRDSVAKMIFPTKAKSRTIAMLRCGDWGTAIVTK